MAQPYEIPEEPRWWEVQNIPVALIRELRRRKNSVNLGFNYPSSGNAEGIAYDFLNKHPEYRGPMTPWVRIYSNGTGLANNGLVPRSSLLNKNGNSQKNYKGFLFLPGNGFYDAFGYKQSGNILKQQNAILGYESDGTPHYIDSVYRNQFSYKWPGTFIREGEVVNSQQKTEVPAILPPPNIESVEIKTSKNMLSFATFKFKCYSLAQLEYLAPFFLTPRLNVFIEIGWNLFNIKSLIDLNNEKECWNIIQTPKSIIDKWYMSYGNYGAITGIITKYNFSTQDGMIYDCNVELTSRQALFAGMPVENNVTTTISEKTMDDKTKVVTDTKEYTGLKTFIKSSLPKLKQAIINRENFANYVIRTRGGSSAMDAEEGFVIDKFKGIAGDFYGGKIENRVFIGRSDASAVYKKPAVPDDTGKITYGTSNNSEVVSYVDKKIDFDKENNTEVWMQLDFIFEIGNLFCSVKKNKTFPINVDTIINAHPNLISCNPHILIPNGVAPKFNIGKIMKDQSELNNNIQSNKISREDAESDAQSGGYLPKGSSNDPFVKGVYDQIISSEKDILYNAASKVKTVFKTADLYRDNLDTVINRLYYDIGGLNEFDPKNNASFPFIYDRTEEYTTDQVVNVDPTSIKNGSIKRTFKRLYSGNLKNIYISQTKVMEIAENKDIETWQQFALAILNTVNDAVDGYWKFEISGDDAGGLSVVDNNYINAGESAPNLKEVYVFDVGGTDSCIKSISMDTSLTSEQATLTLFQAGQNKPDNSKSTMSVKNNSLPAISYIDRLDQFNIDENGTGENNTTPSLTEINVDQNTLIAKLQTYGSQDDVLTMTSAYVKNAEPFDTAPKNYKQLNLPPSLKDKLAQILDDGDTKNNLGLYSGISPNFTLTVTFDGIFGFRMFQHFGISNLPKPYIPENVIFMITDVTHYVTAGNGKWETVVGCLARCVADQNIKLVRV